MKYSTKLVVINDQGPPVFQLIIETEDEKWIQELANIFSEASSKITSSDLNLGEEKETSKRGVIETD